MQSLKLSLGLSLVLSAASAPWSMVAVAAAAAAARVPVDGARAELPRAQPVRAELVAAWAARGPAVSWGAAGRMAAPRRGEAEARGRARGEPEAALAEQTVEPDRMAPAVKGSLRSSVCAAPYEEQRPRRSTHATRIRRGSDSYGQCGAYRFWKETWSPREAPPPRLRRLGQAGVRGVLHDRGRRLLRVGQSVTYSCADGGVVELGNVCATDAGQRS